MSVISLRACETKIHLMVFEISSQGNGAKVLEPILTESLPRPNARNIFGVDLDKCEFRVLIPGRASEMCFITTDPLVSSALLELEY